MLEGPGHVRGGGGTGGSREDGIDAFLLFSLHHSGEFSTAGNGAPKYRRGGLLPMKDGNFPPSLVLEKCKFDFLKDSW